MSFWRNLLLGFVRQGMAICMSCQKEKEKARLCDGCLLTSLALSLIQTVWEDHLGQSSIEAWPTLPRVIKTRCNKNLAWVRERISEICGTNPDCTALEINSSLTVPVAISARLLLCLLYVRYKSFTHVIFLNLPNTLRKVVLFCPIYTWENLSAEDNFFSKMWFNLQSV